MSDTVLLAIIAAMSALMAPIVAVGASYMAARLKRIEDQGATAAVKVAIVAEKAETSEKKIDALAVVTSQTHALVNSASLIQLRLYAVAARRIADLTQEEKDKQAADVAENLVREHEGKQREADAAVKKG